MILKNDVESTKHATDLKMFEDTKNIGDRQFFMAPFEN